MSPSDNGNGWSEYRLLVLQDLARLTEAISRLEEEIHALSEAQTNIREDLAGLKVRAGFFGGIAGALTSIASHLFNRS